jgi:hypothetical protein
LLAVNLGLLIPITPANLGPFEAAVMLALAAFGMHGPQALAMALLYHLVQLVPVTVLGIEGLRFVGEARRAAEGGELSQGRDGHLPQPRPARGNH